MERNPSDDKYFMVKITSENSVFTGKPTFPGSTISRVPKFPSVVMTTYNLNIPIIIRLYVPVTRCVQTW